MNLPPHGTTTRYDNHQCRCAPCSAAKCAYAKKRRYLQDVGRWNPWTDPARARAVQARFTKENPMKYRSKPRTVDAAQWNPTVPAAIGAVIGIVITANEDYRHEGDGLAVVTDGGAFTAQDGDWVVLDDGQLRHFTARQFEARYEKSYPVHMRGPEPLVG